MDDKTDKLTKLFIGLDEKLDTMKDGNFANDCVVDHIRESVKNFLNNKELIGEIANMEVPQEMTEWFAFLVAAISAGPLPSEINITEVLDNIKSRIAKEE